MFRRIRFGTLSLIATMLLVVSAAGWWKFHRDLYEEEQAVLDALAKAGCSVYVSRELPPEEIVSRPTTIEVESDFQAYWTKHLSRIRVLSVTGSPSPELRRRTAALPELEMLQFDEEVDPSTSIPPLPPFEQLLGRATPDLEEPQLDSASVEEPHPEGTPLNEEETSALIAQVRQAWSNSSPPDRFARVVEEEAFGWGSVWLLHARDEAAQLVSEDQTVPDLMRSQVQITNGIESCILEPIETGWRVMSRMSSKLPKRMHLQPVSLDSYIHPVFKRRPADLDHAASAERLEGNKVRLTFRPHVRDLFDVGGPTLSVEERSLILDGDLDWAPVSIREVNRDGRLGPGVPSTRVAHEYRFRRFGEYVLPVEAVGSKFRTRVGWKIDPTFEPNTFEIDSYFDPPVPRRTELPLWRWYRVTFAVSLAFLALLIGRSAIAFARRRPRLATDGDRKAE